MAKLPTDAEELYGRSRTLFIDLLKLGLSLSTGIVGALSFFVFEQEQTVLNSFQKNCFYACLISMLIAIALAIIGWLAQAMYYSSWAYFYPDNGKRRLKWQIIRNVTIGGFAILFLIGVIAGAIFISSFLRVES
jgi:hypothetical protein